MGTFTRRAVFALASSAFAACALSTAVAAYPDRPVRMIIGFPAGGGTDTIGRLLAQELSKIWGQPVTPENRPGADGAIAAAEVAAGPADGSLIGVITNAHTITPAMNRELPYDPVNGFATVAQIATTPNFLLVHPSVPANNVAELIAYAKANPDKLTFGSSGTGTSPYLVMELFKQMAGVKMVHAPYKGGSLAVVGLLSGEIDLMFVSPAAGYEHVKAGKLKAFAISSPQRWAGAPDIPTVAETGLNGFEGATWYGILANKNTPPDIVKKLNADIRKAMSSPAMLQALASQGFDAVDTTPEAFREIIATDIAKWKGVIGNIPK